MANNSSSVVVVGASAGGMEALIGLVAQLPADFPTPVFIVNHMGAETTGKPLVDALNKAGSVKCSHARDGEAFKPGHVYLAPSDQHTLVVKGKMLVTKGARENRYRPAIDPLFRSAAVAYGKGVIGIILTGFLDDGTSGMMAIKRCGGICIVQYPADAAHPDIPQSVIRNVGADYCVPIAQMGALLEKLATRKIGPSKKPPADLVIEAKIAQRVVSDLKSVETLGDLSMVFALMILLFGTVGFSCLAAPATNDFERDFEMAVNQIAAMYAYSDEKATRWDRVSALYADDLRRVSTRDEFIGLLERVVDELYDHHAHLTVNLENSLRLVPSGTDLWAEWRDGRATITQVRSGSDAERAGIRPGAVVLAIGGVPITDAVGARLGRSYPHSTAAARDWALRVVLAGRHGEGRLLEIEENGVGRTVNLPSEAQFERAGTPLEASEIRPGIGYEERVTEVRRSWLELVSPREGFRYAQPVTVLVNRWTGSMGEGLAIGFDATGTGTVVGTAMAGLVGATMRITLPHTNIGINLPNERLYHVDGTPREAFRPAVLVDVGSADPGLDPFIEAALEVLAAR